MGLPLLRTKRRDVLKISKEAVIRTTRAKLVTELASMIGELQEMVSTVLLRK